MMIFNLGKKANLQSTHVFPDLLGNKFVTQLWCLLTFCLVYCQTVKFIHFPFRNPVKQVFFTAAKSKLRAPFIKWRLCDFFYNDEVFLTMMRPTKWPVLRGVRNIEVVFYDERVEFNIEFCS